MLQAGSTAMGHSLRQAGIRFQQRTIDTILGWAKQAASPEPTAAIHHQLAIAPSPTRHSSSI